MKEEYASFDFPELKEMPSLEFDDNFSINITEGSKSNAFDDIGIEIESNNINKIHEYLDRDLEEQNYILERLKILESKIDEYIKNQKVITKKN